ncbi:uncharacterized protein LOC133188903 [Saccostrea echinata]|uniref:uncharacterized protein LOC133188903 n=1 Tax=Saccostrea echinata TaxID=191078 RepID=UPI002A80E3A2|nr:uncharacterized protein LOC133188903 [Saccostrea echinata]
MDLWSLFLLVFMTVCDFFLLVRADLISTPSTCRQDSNKADRSTWEAWNLVIYILIGAVIFFAFCCCICAHFVNWKRNRKQASESNTTPTMWSTESSAGSHYYNAHVNLGFSSSDTDNSSTVPSAPLYTGYDLPPSYESVMEQTNRIKDH